MLLRENTQIYRVRLRGIFPVTRRRHSDRLVMNVLVAILSVEIRTAFNIFNVEGLADVLHYKTIVQFRSIECFVNT